MSLRNRKPRAAASKNSLPKFQPILDYLHRLYPRIMTRMMRRDMIIFLSLLLVMLIGVIIMAGNLSRFLPDYLNELVEYQGNTANFEKDALPLTRMLAAPEGYQPISDDGDQGAPIWPLYNQLNLPDLLNLMNMKSAPENDSSSYEVYPELYYRPAGDNKEESWYISSYLVNKSGLTNKMNVLIDGKRGITLIECSNMRDPSITVDPKDAENMDKTALDLTNQFLDRLVTYQLQIIKQIRNQADQTDASGPTVAPSRKPAAGQPTTTEFMDTIVPENEKLMPEITPLENGYYRVTYTITNNVQLLIDVDAINYVITRYQMLRS